MTYVSWGDATHYVNWIQNGEPTAPEGPGTTESGTYALNGSTGGAELMAVTAQFDGNLGNTDFQRVVQSWMVRWRGNERRLLGLPDAK